MLIYVLSNYKIYFKVLPTCNRPNEAYLMQHTSFKHFTGSYVTQYFLLSDFLIFPTTVILIITLTELIVVDDMYIILALKRERETF